MLMLIAPPAVLHQLRQATTSLHRQLDRESCMAQLMQPQLTQHQYVQILQALHSVYVPLEFALATQAPCAAPGALSAWQAKAPLLVDDLHAMGYAPLPPVVGLKLPALGLTSQYAGVCYVLEGACLGGAVIRKKLRNQWGEQADSYTRFFAGNGTDTARQWAGFCQQLGALLPATQECPDIELACESARQTFKLFIDGLSTVHIAVNSCQ